MSTDVSTPRPIPQSNRPAAGPGPDRRHTLLIVDDEVDVLESLRHLFHRTYRVLTANSGDQAVETLGRTDVHLILSDQRMPGMTGDVFLSHARRLNPDAIRMLFTGYADIQAVINAVNEGRIFRYILKPWDPIELEGIVRQAIDHHDLIVDRRRLVVELKEVNDRLTRANRELVEANQQKLAMQETGRLRSDLDSLLRRVKALEEAAGGATHGRSRAD
jgi:response regulator RpfG family c-di-GMP phosphodiesterase